VKCIFCKICEERLAIFNRQYLEWLEAQSNSVALMEREADPQLVYEAHDLRETDPEACFGRYLTLAEGGSVWSMGTVGYMLENGTGIARDLVQAEEWYLRAHGAGSDYALIWLGLLYLETNRHEKAQDIFRTGVGRGFAPAMYHLAFSYWKSGDWLQKRNEAMLLLQRGATAGDLGAQRFLVTSMLRGRFGLQYVPAGFRLLSKVANDDGKIIEDDKAATESIRGKPLGFFGRLAASFWTASQTKAGAMPGANRTSLLSTGR
jgi:TPR repeat protein